MSTELPDVTDLIPHRGRWRLVDELVAHDGQSLTARTRFDLAFVDGHFPDQPVVPGVALVEALAQTLLCLTRLVEAPDPDGVARTPLLVGLDRVRFRAPVLPPAEVLLQVTITDERGGMVRAKGEAQVDGAKAVTCQLTGTRVELPRAEA